jgi:DUF4097 and DUF4098 domain-containing protein YvlB
VYEFTEDFDSIHMNLDTADVRFVLAEDGVCRVECMESEKLGYTVEAKDGVLNVSVKDNRKWYDYIGMFNFSRPMTVYLPKTQYDRLSIDVSTGDVEIPDGLSFGKITLNGSTGDVSIGRVTVNSLDIEISTGEIALGGVRATNMTLKTSTGEISLTDVCVEDTLSVENSTGGVNLTDVISYRMKVECSTGDVELKRCDAVSIRIETSTGDVEGTLRSGKNFTTDSNTGDVDVPRDSDGGVCEIFTDTGDIRITIS